ncbi:MAG: MarC family protein [Patescibacteria group bacterium]|jgi:multiple antibiotic resistance protein
MSLLVSTAITIFLLMDFIGGIPVFLILTQKENKSDRRKIAILSSLIAGLMIGFFAFCGQTILDYFGFSIDALRVGGGIIMLYIAFEMIFSGQMIYVKDNEARNVAISPLATPMLAGPGALSFAMTTLVSASGPEKAIVLMAILLASLVGAIIFIFSPTISRILGKEAVRGIEKIVALLLSGVAAEMIMGGIQGYFG